MMLGSVNIQDLNMLSIHLKEMGEFYKLDDDIHLHTHRIGDHFRNCFYPLDIKYQLSSLTGNFKETYDDILKYCKGEPLVKVALDNLKAYKNQIEPETGLIGQALLVRTWQLAKQTTYPNPLDLVIDNLKHNKMTGGGCYAGIVGRLVSPYTQFVNQAILNLAGCDSQEMLTASLASLSEQVHTDKEMEKALALSLSESKEKPIEENTDKALQMALASSLSEYEAKQTEINGDFYFSTLISPKTLTFTRLEMNADPAKRHRTADGFSVDELEYAIELSKLIY